MKKGQKALFLVVVAAALVLTVGDLITVNSGQPIYPPIIGKI
jgi:hypothetical protein